MLTPLKKHCQLGTQQREHHPQRSLHAYCQTESAARWQRLLLVLLQYVPHSLRILSLGPASLTLWPAEAPVVVSRALLIAIDRSSSPRQTMGLPSSVTRHITSLTGPARQKKLKTLLQVPLNSHQAGYSACAADNVRLCIHQLACAHQRIKPHPAHVSV